FGSGGKRVTTLPPYLPERLSSAMMARRKFAAGTLVPAARPPPDPLDPLAGCARPCGFCGSAALIAFVHEQRKWFLILTGGLPRVIGRLPSADRPHPRIPRQIRLSGEVPPPREDGCPQILWIIVCVSCKFEC